MTSEVLKRDENHITVGSGVSNDVALDVTMLRTDPITGYLLVQMTSSGATSANAIQIAKRDENHRTVCLAYNESTDELQEILTDSSGNLLCDLA